MKILSVSDSHGDLSALVDVVERNAGQFQLLLHLGDGMEELGELCEIYPKLEYAAVRGNCDDSGQIEATNTLILKGVKIWMTHGHLFGVKRSLAYLLREAQQREAKLVFFGHTHQPYAECVEGIWFVNPGSIGGHRGSGARRTYALTEIDGGQVRDCRILEG